MYISGYFVYDLLDLVVNNRLITNYEIVLHHFWVSQCSLFHTIFLRSYSHKNIIVLTVWVFRKSKGQFFQKINPDRKHIYRKVKIYFKHNKTSLFHALSSKLLVIVWYDFHMVRCIACIGTCQMCHVCFNSLSFTYI